MPPQSFGRSVESLDLCAQRRRFHIALGIDQQQLRHQSDRIQVGRHVVAPGWSRIQKLLHVAWRMRGLQKNSADPAITRIGVMLAARKPLNFHPSAFLTEQVGQRLLPHGGGVIIGEKLDLLGGQSDFPDQGASKSTKFRLRPPSSFSSACRSGMKRRS
jgi:hypothetical protein